MTTEQSRSHLFLSSRFHLLHLMSNFVLRHSDASRFEVYTMQSQFQRHSKIGDCSIHRDIGWTETQGAVKPPKPNRAFQYRHYCINSRKRDSHLE